MRGYNGWRVLSPRYQYSALFLSGALLRFSPINSKSDGWYVKARSCSKCAYAY